MIQRLAALYNVLNEVPKEQQRIIKILAGQQFSLKTDPLSLAVSLGLLPPHILSVFEDEEREEAESEVAENRLIQELIKELIKEEAN